MATYPQIDAEVRRRFGYAPKSCWIAHVKDHHGLTTRIAPNRKDPIKRENPCPPEKWADIEAVIRSFGMIT